MYVFGPVPSRRLGRSLGISTIPPKTCSYSCVYCQLGRTSRLQVKRESFYPKREILDEIIEVARKTKPEYITFSGDGEPTLCRDLGWLIRRIKSASSLPVAVITNGSLLYREDVRQDLEKADVVIPSLDAAHAKLFKDINRPHRSLDLDLVLKGLMDFSSGFSGRIWLEVMLVKNLNASKESLEGIKKAADRIEPDRIYIITPIRPPAEPWVEPPEPSGILEAQEIIGNSVPFGSVESGPVGFQGFSSARQAILDISSRHPLRRDQAAEIESGFSSPGTVRQMLEAGELVETKYMNRTYLLPGHFVIGGSRSEK